MFFMLGNITIRCICVTQHLNIIFIIMYFNIFNCFGHYSHNNIYTIILIILHRTAGPSRCLLSDIYNKFVVLTTDKPRLFTVVVFFYQTFFQQYG